MMRRIILMISILLYASAVRSGDQMREALLGGW